jgi:release factor glutamine methyltransferase
LLNDVSNYGTFDAVVSNPPYIPSSELNKLPKEIANYEPALALDGGEDGLAVFRQILPQAAVLLRPGGLFACELHEDCLDTAAACMDSEHYADSHIHNDLTQRPRVITATRL